MIYVLFGSLLLVFILCYFFSGKDFFAPATVQILTFLGAVFMCIYFMWSMDCPHDFQWITIGMIMTAMLMSAVIGIIVHHLFSRIEIKSHSLERVDISPIPNAVSIFVITIIIGTIFWLLNEIRRIGGTSGSFFITMSRFRAISSYSTEENGRLPWLLSQLITLVRIFFLLYGYDLIRFFHELTIAHRTVNLLVLGLAALTSLLTGGRTYIVNDLFCLVVIFHLLRIQRQGGYKTYSLRYLLRFGLIVLLIMAAFFLTKSFVGRTGRNNTMNPVDYISYYTGSGLIAFDKYLRYPPSPSYIWGKETFYRLNSFLINYNLIDLSPYLMHLEFRPVGAGFKNNVYTFLRSYHYDFGVAGMYFLHGLSIVFLSVFYEYVKKKRGSLGILIFGQMYYAIVMSFFAERFYSNIFSLNYVKQLVILLVLYELFIRKRIRFKFRRSAHIPQPVPSKTL